MASLGKRIAVHGGLVVVGLFVFGAMFAQIAGVWVASQMPVRADLESWDGAPAAPSDELAGQMKWRVPFTMAAMGFGLVVIFELLGSLWTKPKAEQKPSVTDDELLIQRLLKEAEANPANTPAPLGALAPETTDDSRRTLTP